MQEAIFKLWNRGKNNNCYKVAGCSIRFAVNQKTQQTTEEFNNKKQREMNLGVEELETDNKIKKIEGEIHTSILSYTETPAASQEATINWATKHHRWKLSC